MIEVQSESVMEPISVLMPYFQPNTFIPKRTIGMFMHIITTP